MNIFSEMAKYNVMNKKLQYASDSAFTQAEKGTGTIERPFEFAKVATFFPTVNGTINVVVIGNGSSGGNVAIEVRKKDGSVVASYEDDDKRAIPLMVSVEAFTDYDVFLKYQNKNAAGPMNISIELRYSVVDVLTRFY